MKINEIPPEGLDLKLQQSVDLLGSEKQKIDCSAILSIKPVGSNRFRVTGSVKAAPQLECSRCLKAFVLPVDAEVDVELAPLESMGDAAEHELGRSELDTGFYRENEIELVEIVKEQVLIAIPMVPLHDPACKGLCPSCGMDLNTGKCDCPGDRSRDMSPFAELKKLFNK